MPRLPVPQPLAGLRWVPILVWTGGLAIIALLLGLAALAAVAIAVRPDRPVLATIWERQSQPSITILDKDDALVMTRGERAAPLLALKDMPRHLPDAFLAIEDRRFYAHGGVDPWGILRAVLANLRAGALIQGGSTITQQLAKNLFLTPERSLVRKLQEADLAYWLEGRLSKDAILTLYLNRVYLGAGNYGVEAASRYYFGKSARDVTLAEAAMLAGLPKAPTRFAPTRDLAAAQARAAVVLDSLERGGFLSEDQIAPAQAAPAALAKTEAQDETNYFVDWILDELWAIPNEDEVEAWRGKNLVVATTFDRTLQIKGEIAVFSTLTDADPDRQISQAALVAIDPSGAVRAMVGGKSYAESQFNRAARAQRQPGSAFKPFVYLAALERGLEPDDLIEDGPITVEGWSPDNADETFAGEVSLRSALARSLNTVAVRLSEMVGRANVIDTARRLGIAAPLEPHPSIALGTGEVTLLELSGAYLPFLNDGFPRPAFGIRTVRTDQGAVLYTHPAPPAERVVAARYARLMTAMLGAVVTEGTGRGAQLKDRPAAGKTGTSQDYRDAWFVGYTPQLLTGVWVGNDDSSPMNRVTGGSLAASLWRDFMDRAHYGALVMALPSFEPIEEQAVAAAEPLSGVEERPTPRWMFWKRRARDADGAFE